MASAPARHSSMLSGFSEHTVGSRLEKVHSDPTAQLHIGSPPDARTANLQSPILEEDESHETSSEPMEPVTPTNDTVPHSFPQQNGKVQNVPMVQPSSAAKPIPTRTPSKPAPAPQPTKTAQHSQAASNDTPKPGLGKRVGSFMSKHLHRNKKDDDSAANASPPKAAANNSSVTKPAQLPQQPQPTRRFSSFRLSAKNSPESSQSNTPPSPGSPVQTMDDKQPFSRQDFAQQPSAPEIRFDVMEAPPGPPKTRLTWNANDTDSLAPPAARGGRRRSLSTDNLPSMVRVPKDPNDPDVGLLDAVSRPAVQGAGLKARRLSYSLPDEFTVDYCELYDEFEKSGKLGLKRGSLCGKGATAEVRLMNRKGQPDALVAVKEFRERDPSDENEREYLQKIKSEYTIAKSMNHPNIVETFRLCTHRGRWNHVMEYCGKGELYTMAEAGLFRSHFSLDDRLCFFKQMLRGIEYMHTHGIAHRDIKLENLLMNSEGHIKISDFGVSEVFSGEHPGLRAAGGECGKNMGEIRRCAPGICGSLPYIAPEVLQKSGDYDPRPLDVWSCAIVFLTMTYSGSPWEAADPKHQHYARFKKGWDEWLPNHPDGKVRDEKDGMPKCGPVFMNLNVPGLKRLMLKMLHPVPEMRISITEALNSAYIKGVECCTLESADEPSRGVDASGKSGKIPAAKLKVQKKHNHIPPEKSKVPNAFKYRFDMGDGWT
ncbi:HAL protein kinase [Coniosporium apollinis CBS 100218]|uniref:HAL protein kinase n=1 Tax=Coniosporium apollinis (strain CBS 100218) TaxID=1168221 RepID=R7YS14_CONA1|nr:HAL protein kinase [Coniosporium apollinis CBS 100218]EON64623.1 HAL protein kinase [Coniosporium apollinis CBS 100218]